MTKRLCICTGLAGTLLVLAAVLMITHSGHQDTRASQHMRLAQAVSELDGCLTCHATPNQDSAVLVVNEPQSNLLLADLVGLVEMHHTPLMAAQIPTAEVETELRTIGHRLLDLPDAQAEQAGDMIDAYLTVYDTVRANDAAYNTESLLATLSEIESALRTLEYTAQGVHWGTPDVSTSQPDVVLAAASIQGSPTPSVAWATAITLEQTASPQIILADAAAIRITPALAYALLRRGPPAAHDHTTLVAGRRLPVAL